MQCTENVKHCAILSMKKFESSRVLHVCTLLMLSTKSRDRKFIYTLLNGLLIIS